MKVLARIQILGDFDAVKLNLCAQDETNMTSQARRFVFDSVFKMRRKNGAR